MSGSRTVLFVSFSFFFLFFCQSALSTLVQKGNCFPFCFTTLRLNAVAITRRSRRSCSCSVKTHDPVEDGRSWGLLAMPWSCFPPCGLCMDSAVERCTGGCVCVEGQGIVRQMMGHPVVNDGTSFGWWLAFCLLAIVAAVGPHEDRTRTTRGNSLKH